MLGAVYAQAGAIDCSNRALRVYCAGRADCGPEESGWGLIVAQGRWYPRQVARFTMPLQPVTRVHYRYTGRTLRCNWNKLDCHWCTSLDRKVVQIEFLSPNS